MSEPVSYRTPLFNKQLQRDTRPREAEKGDGVVVGRWGWGWGKEKERREGVQVRGWGRG